MIDDWPWSEPGLEANVLDVPPGTWNRVVACLNIWNDVDELRRTWLQWLVYVDHVIAVDGAYRGVETDVPWSTDGTLDVLSTAASIEIVEATEFWPDQRTKRTAYFERGQPGDLFFVIDADEFVYQGDQLRTVPDLDVGWVDYRSPVYRRGQHQPRLFRWRPGLAYRGRHHWLTWHKRPVATHQQGGVGFVHRHVPMSFVNNRGRARSAARRMAVSGHRMDQDTTELSIGPRVTAHEPLRIFHVGPFDPGNVICRLHTAINTSSPHWSAMATGDAGPCAPPRQYALDVDRLILRDVVATADVVHHHVMRVAEQYLDVRIDGTVEVMHHHGTEFRRDPGMWADRDAGMALRLVSNLELLQYAENLTYLPNPVSVARYRALRRRPRWDKRPLRVCHSPTKRDIKGTAEFLTVCDRLQGLVEPVLIEGVSVGEAIRLKATCHACFDSFWLGMQCAGLEAAAIGMAVIAGDPDVQRESLAQWGYVPYTYANDAQGLQAALERLATDYGYFRLERRRVAKHVAAYHDGPAVVAAYLDLLDRAVGWRTLLAVGERLPLRRAS